MKNKTSLQKQGIALLLSVIITSIVLAISMGLSNIVSIETFLSNTGRQSQLAFYAADAGVDCAIYWDTISNSVFATQTPVTSNTITNACAGDKIKVGGYDSCVGGPTGNEGPSACTGANEERKAGVSKFTLSFENGSCANVTVTRAEDLSDPNFPTIKTVIRSDGHSSGGNDNGSGGFAECASTNPRHFQRSLETTSYGE